MHVHVRQLARHSLWCTHAHQEAAPIPAYGMQLYNPFLDWFFAVNIQVDAGRARSKLHWQPQHVDFYGFIEKPLKAESAAT